MATTGTPRRPSSSGGDGFRGSPPPNPPRRSRRARKAPPKRGFWRSVRIFFSWIMLLILIVACVAIGYVYLQIRNTKTTAIPTFNPPGRTSILSSDGVPLATVFTQNRQVVSINKIPKDLQNATVALEDQRFYQHNGIDFWGIGRALTRNLRSGELKGEGASTITQQLARNSGVDGLTSEKSIQRKIHEWVIANQIEKNFTKQQILEAYLNQVNYGSGAYGVQQAAATYFGKDVQKLNLAECALIAGLPNAPTRWNPYKDKELSKKQRNIVLGRMLDQKYVTPAQYQEAIAAPVRLASPKAPKRGSQIYHAPFFVNYVMEQLKAKYGEDYLLRGNLRVYTTLNWEMQQVAEEEVRKEVSIDARSGPNQACLVAIDPKTGQIKALVGGVDYGVSNFNIATQGRRQPGSLFKAIVYAGAIDSDLVTEDTRVLDSPISFRTGAGIWTPKDDNGYSNSRVTLKVALARSINVPAVKVLKEFGPQNAVRYARVMGIESPLDPVLSLALGSSGVTPLEMTSAYATFANGGNHPVTSGFTRVEETDGTTVEDIPAAIETHVISPKAATQLDDMLRAVVIDEHGTGYGAGVIPNSRGKTGTTQGHKDTWFIGYTPNLVVGVWAGRPVRASKHHPASYGEEMGGNSWGATECVPIWTGFMKRAEPIFLKAIQKELARAKTKPKKPAPKPVATPDESTTTGEQSAEVKRPRRNRRSGDSAADFTHTPENTPAAADATKNSDSTDNGDGTVTVNIDNDTGLIAAPGAPNSSRSTFAKGAEPTQRTPDYDKPRDFPGDPPSPGADSNSGDNNDSSVDNSNAPHRRAETPSDMTTVRAISIPAVPHARTPRIPPAPRPKRVEYVTVNINPEDGLLATKWDPEVIEKTFIKGQEPRKRSRLHRPPPGEAQ
ncbi:MAG: PBP1A family penicillin-binding protein [Capsulimonas sp.]|uniref:transglycosylase domain-containing protein n=1 Tax=Capsulimonas sp. TaxID=2494211 RepID=UPI0032670E95